MKLKNLKNIVEILEIFLPEDHNIEIKGIINFCDIGDIKDSIVRKNLIENGLEIGNTTFQIENNKDIKIGKCSNCNSDIFSNENYYCEDCWEDYIKEQLRRI